MLLPSVVLTVPFPQCGPLPVPCQCVPRRGSPLPVPCHPLPSHHCGGPCRRCGGHCCPNTVPCRCHGSVWWYGCMQWLCGAGDRYRWCGCHCGAHCRLHLLAPTQRMACCMPLVATTGSSVTYPITSWVPIPCWGGVAVVVPCGMCIQFAMQRHMMAHDGTRSED